MGPSTATSGSQVPDSSTAAPAHRSAHPVIARSHGHGKTARVVRPGQPSVLPPAQGVGCAQTRVCNGTPAPELVAAFQYRAQGTRRCYERELRHTPKAAQGRIAVEVQLDATGHVCQTTIVQGGEWASRALSNCVTRVMGGDGYPAPLDDCVDVVVPLRFVANHS
jgi:hypothetical protein